MFKISFSGLTVDSILKDFTFKIDQLNAIASNKRQEADRHEEAMGRAEIARNAAKAEAARAAAIASRIEALVG